MRYLAIAALCLLATTAYAELDPVPDGIGIYADLDATEVSISAHPFELFPVYLLLTNPSQDGLMAAWGATIEAPANAQIIAWNIQGGAFLNFASPPEFNVCFLPPGCPTEPIVHLMTFIVQMTDDEPGYFRVLPSVLAGEAFADHPFYMMVDDLELPYWLHNFQGDDGQVVFAVNGPITPVEAMSWSGIKNLF
ncbi:MAG: hypothetical protein R3D98_04895 [Candidatus Krumholzibacteriia bacterium]